MNRELIRNNEKFQNALAGLNKQQLEAVNQIDGPVLVIAGPGTGKTQILAARIGKILLETDAEAHNILCLTYTDAGTIAMRKRLFDFIGPEAYRVHIHTFHSFCNDIIQENLDYFGKLNLEAISDLERIELFRKLVHQFKEGNPLKRYRGDVYYEIDRLMPLFSILKRENWTPEYVCEKADEYLNMIDNAEEGSDLYKTFRYVRKGKNNEQGDFKPGYQKEKESINLLKYAVKEFNNYQQIMRDANRYDFDDMIIWILKAFQADENFLLSYQERYQYFLIDEYQDTSGSQNELIRLLIDFWEKPNVFVVGDDDQSIFRFQGANVENIEQYCQWFPQNLAKIMLQNNYRSTQSILDLSKNLIDFNTERIQMDGLSKSLVASNSNYTTTSITPKIIEYETPIQEFASVTEQVYHLITIENVDPKEIAVIYKEHKSGEELAQYFQNREIPVSTKKRVNILTIPFAKKLINILRYIAAENDISYSGDELLFQILHYDFYDINPIDIAKLSVEVNRHNYSNKERTSIRRMLVEMNKQTVDLFQETSVQHMRRLSQDVEYWIKESNNLTLQNLFEKIITRGGILAYILKSPEKTWLMQVLSSLFNFLKEESRRNPDMGLKEFVSTIDLLADNNLSLELNKVLFNEHGVNFLTCHGSKGLEFQHVFLIGATKSVWEGKRKYSKTYKIPETLFLSSSKGKDEEELRRLFYVAMTRAKTNLQISYSSTDMKGKEIERSMFVGELLSASNIQPEKISIADPLILDFFALNFIDDNAIVSTSSIDHNWIDSVLDKYTLSVTHLNNYLSCPLKFYFQNLVMVPSGKNETMTFGSSVHWALEKFFREVVDTQEFPPVKNLLRDFDWYMIRNREAFTKEQFERRLEYGHKIIPPYYERYINEWHKIVSTETAIKNVEINGIPIKGKIDKIEFDGNNVNVVDYKTGNYENAKKKFLAPNDKEPLGGDYWRQAVFYKILIDNYRIKDWRVISTEFDFVEPYKEEYVKHKIVISPEDVKTVTNQIQEVYAKIKRHEFTTGCGKKECEWCTFVKNNFRDAEFVFPTEEDEENED
jgi:DNA helicase-2/ATP-dependent DNA helicase PcrA